MLQVIGDDKIKIYKKEVRSALNWWLLVETEECRIQDLTFFGPYNLVKELSRARTKLVIIFRKFQTSPKDIQESQ